jgi:hypothetical protein
MQLDLGLPSEDAKKERLENAVDVELACVPGKMEWPWLRIRVHTVVHACLKKVLDES